MPYVLYGLSVGTHISCKQYWWDLFHVGSGPWVGDSLTSHPNRSAPNQLPGLDWTGLFISEPGDSFLGGRSRCITASVYHLD
jgi:hypothetical protein